MEDMYHYMTTIVIDHKWKKNFDDLNKNQHSIFKNKYKYMYAAEWDV